MDVGKILNADMQTVSRTVLRAVDAWRAEMTALLPERWRRFAPTRPKRIVRLHMDEGSGRPRGFRLERWDGTAYQAETGPLEGNRRKAMLVLPSSAGLLRRIDLPMLSQGDARRLVALDIDRLMPFPAGEAIFDLDVERVDPARNRQSVLVGAIRHETLTQAMAAAREWGVIVAGVSLADETGSPRLDFVAARQGRDGPVEAERWRAWGIAGAALGLNLFLFIAMDIASLTTLREEVEATTPMVSAVQKMRAAYEDETNRRQALVDRKARTSPLAVLDSLSALLPSTVWVQRLEWNGERVRLSGWSRGSEDLVALIEADAKWKNVQSLPSSEAKNDAAGRGKPFEIVAERERPTTEKGP